MTKMHSDNVVMVVRTAEHHMRFWNARGSIESAGIAIFSRRSLLALR